MEEGYSTSSSLNKPDNPKGNPDAHEESGWTSYFEDFLSNQREQQEEHSSSDHYHHNDTISLVSDAASFFKYKADKTIHAYGGCGSPKFSKKLNFKKTRTREISHDDSLEDTASSPVNSPKVGSLKDMDMISHRKTDDHSIDSLPVKRGGSEHDSDVVLQADEGNDYTDLRKRGLGLIPMSMLVNYFG